MQYYLGLDTSKLSDGAWAEKYKQLIEIRVQEAKFKSQFRVL